MTADVEVLKPPALEVGVLGWLKKNLFATWYDALLTVISVAFICAVLYGVGNWALNSAKWGVVTTNIKVFMVGRYPYAQIWRVWGRVEHPVTRTEESSEKPSKTAHRSSSSRVEMTT